MRIALNGFGRIGKNFLRCILADDYARDTIDIVAINVGPADVSALEYMVKYDTILRTFPGFVRMSNNTLTIDRYSIKIYAETDATKLPWAQEKIDWVVDVSGKYTQRDTAEQHMQAGAGAVLISAPAQGEDCTIILGINAHVFDADTHKIVSLGSCTTNAIVPLIKIIDDAFGIQYGTMTTVHAYTSTQSLLDGNAEINDPRRSRAATLNIVPTSTGAMDVVTRVLPHLEGKLSGCALRVPVSVVSIVDFVFTAHTQFDKKAINAACKEAVNNTALKGFAAFSTDPLVSSDYQGNSNSVIIDALMTQAAGPMGKIFGWYDNEWGYSCRLRDFLKLVVK